MKINTKNITLVCFLVGSIAHGSTTYSFGPTGGSPVTIIGSDNGTGSAITYTSALIQGGTASVSTHDTTSGTVPGGNLGGTYDGTFFDSAVDGDTAFTTSIESTRREDIDEGISGNYANYIGISVEFSAPISLESFGFIDLDGDVSSGQNEWVGSFGTLSGTAVIPTVALGDPTQQAQRAAGTTVDWSGIIGAPTSYAIAFNNNNTAGEDPDSASTQISFDYGGDFVDRIYFVWGLEGDETGGANGNNASGVTGFVVDETVSIPEPSSGVLFGLGGLVLLARRKRA